MAKQAGTVTTPIYARINGKEIHLGDLVVPVRIVNGQVKAPSEREIIKLLKRLH